MKVIKSFRFRGQTRFHSYLVNVSKYSKYTLAVGEISMIHELLFLFFLVKVELERDEKQRCSNSNPLSTVQLLYEQKQPELLSSCCSQNSSALTQKSELERGERCHPAEAMPICSHCYHGGRFWCKSSSTSAGRVRRCLYRLVALGRLAHDHPFEASSWSHHTPPHPLKARDGWLQLAEALHTCIQFHTALCVTELISYR